MSANARRRLNQQLANYWPTVFAALNSEDETYVDPTTFHVLPCPTCGTLLLGFCPHPRPTR